ncbi:MAG: beta-lactamase family protein [Oscillospiraceae bacterium]|jgi:CubicO group peptidase (beta-lactamase class C family)|nr:beta-lactamase family protein [Oscillospiraceae bacterium]
MNPIKITAAEAAELGVDLERMQWLNAYLQRMIDENKHPFEAIRFWRKNTLIFSGEYGAQNPSGELLRSDAIYPVASVTKSYLATCAAILQEEGRVSFYEKVQDYFPDFVGENKENVILWHLLCHTSGIDDQDEGEKYIKEFIKKETGTEIGNIWLSPEESEKFYGGLYELRAKLGLPDSSSAKDAKELLIMRAPLASLPGTKFSYCSVGYGMWKTIIERITGETLEKYARRKLFEPLGLNDTHFFLPPEKRTRFVIRGADIKGAPWMNSEDSMTSTDGDGGLKTTMNDMARFGLMYLNEGKLDGKRIMSPTSIKLLTKNHNSTVPDSLWFGRWLAANWGLGWDIKGENKIDELGMLRGARSYNHGGYGGARLLVDPDYDLVLAIYMCEKEAFSVYDDMGSAVDILYGALD